MPKKNKKNIAYAYAFYVFKVKLILEVKDDGSYIEPSLQFSIFNLFFFPIYHLLRAMFYFTWLIQGLLLGEKSTRGDYVPLLSRDKENTKKLKDFLSKQE